MSLRAVTRIAALALLLLLCLPPFAIFSLFGKGAVWVRLFLNGTGRILGLRVRVEGQPIDSSVLYAANHIAWLDIPALGGTRYTRFIAKSQISGWAVIGVLARIAGSVFVQRERRSATRAQADEIVGALREGFPLGLFPEGGTGDGRAVYPFRPALFAAAVEAGVTVQPVAIDYGARSADIAWPKGVSFGSEMKRMLNRPAPVPVTIHFLAPLDAGRLDRKALAAQSQDAVARALRQPVAITP